MENKKINQEQWVLPLYNTVLFPKMAAKIELNKVDASRYKNLFDNQINYLIGLTVKEAKKNGQLAEYDLFNTGTLLKVESFQTSARGVSIHVKAIKKVKVEQLFFNENEITARYAEVEDIADLSTSNEANMLEFIKKFLLELSTKFQGSEPFVREMERLSSLEEIIALVMPYLQIGIAKKIELLEESSRKEIGMQFMDLLVRQKDLIDFQIDLSHKINEKFNKSHREAILREQLKAIQEELGEGNSSKKKDYRALIEAAEMPEDVKEVAMEQVDKLDSFGPQNHESGIIQNYLDLLITLPWKTGANAEIDINNSREILDNEHYSLEKVKERIIQHLAVMKLKKEKKGSILLLVGPPGTGKTSLGKSIANALGRKYLRMSLGGIRDEAEIRGHRRTYIGALPGRIIQGMKKAGEKNPVFVLDEIDKLMTAYSGDPASALLEVLDPEQNNSFVDHYLEVPYDLSEVFFVATANSLNSIPGPLLDRMEVIEISSYTNREKLEISKRHLLKEVIEEHGLLQEQIIINDDTMETIIGKYTREAGVRGLKKQLAKIVRVVTEKIVSGKSESPFILEEKNLVEILGRQKVRLDNALKEVFPGVVTGLAWTPVGGDVLFIESSFMKGKGELILTGQLGDVMKESAKISMSLIRSRLVHMIKQFDFSKNDIHIHVPSGAIPKDGPSAGITLFTALASMILGKSVDTKLAMTGEITLRGSVMPVGGIKEKVLAAHRAGIKKILLSIENEEDVNEIPVDVREQLKFKFVKNIEDVVEEALGISLPKAVFYSDHYISGKISDNSIVHN